MKLYTVAPTGIRNLVAKEIIGYRKIFSVDKAVAWGHLERAHVIGQPYPGQHTLVHWEMFKFGLKTKNIREILGQFPRLLTGGVKSFVGVIPVGNTGGANVPPLRPMPIPDELNQLINQALKTSKS